jgi:phosphoribosylamine--glycine ligase
MGAFTPSGVYTPEIEKYCNEKIFLPTLEALKKEDIVFKGVIYFGLMLTAKGPKVLEYNARFGDRETQVILPLLKSDLLDIFDACIDGELEKIDISWSDEAAVCVVMASGGYPESYQKGFEITGLDKLSDNSRQYIYHAGTRKEADRYYTNGGRVLGVTAVAENISSARDIAYDLASKIDFEGKFYRKDIGIK